MIRGVIGTGGHIDHGKTALVAALTGIDTDRLPEEKQRGISIDIGFSHLQLDDRVVGVVDVPGHEDFVRNMVAGATGIDLLLLVVAADEGVMPQTREHVAIAELLQVPRAVVALTKADLVDDDWLPLALDDAHQLIQGTPFAHAPVLPVSSTTSQGLDELRRTLSRLLSDPTDDVDDLFRMPVDRSFTVRGTGTVVTGTVWSGALERDQRVTLLPGGAEARVRGLQVHGRETERVEAGQRAAVALVGVDRDQVGRGETVVQDEGWESSSILTVRLRSLEGTGWALEQRQRVRVHLGTAEVMARLVLLETDRMEGGADGWAQLRLEEPLVARAGDAFVLRSYSPMTTIGGGTVAEPVAPKRRRLDERERELLRVLVDGDAAARVQWLLDLRAGQGVPVGELATRYGLAPRELEASLERAAAAVTGDRAFGQAAVEAVAETLSDRVRSHHQERPLQPGIDAAQLRQAAPPASHPALIDLAMDRLVDAGRLLMRDGRLAQPGHSPRLTEGHQELRRSVLRMLAADRDSPPRLDELRERLHEPPDLLDLLELMESRNELTRVEADLFMEPGELGRLRDAVTRQLGGRDDLTPGDFRTAIPLSRRHLIPILEYLDREGVTVRNGDRRTVPAPQSTAGG